MPFDTLPQYRDTISYARRRPRDGRSFNRIEARPAIYISRSAKSPRSPFGGGWSGRIAAVTSVLREHVIAGFAAYAAAAHMEAIWVQDPPARPSAVPRRRPGNPPSALATQAFQVPLRRSSPWIAVRSSRLAVAQPAVATEDLRRLGRWMGSVPRRLWSRVRRAQEMSRRLAAWEAIDERTLRDIGVARHQVVRGAQSWLHWR